MYRTLYEHSLDAVILQSPDGQVFAANPAACEMFQRTEAEICKLGRSCLVDERDELFRAALEERERTGSVKSEIQLLRGDGSQFYGEVGSAQFINDDGEAMVVLIIHDITNRKQAERALIDSEERYRTIFENSPLGLFRSTVAGQFLEANIAMANMLGYDTPMDLIDSIHDIGKQLYVNAQDRRKIVDKQLHESNDIAHYFNRYRRRDGRELLANLYLKTIRDEKGTPVYFDGIIEDVTETKMAEDELRASEARFRSFSDHAMDAFFLHGEKGIVLDANRQACLSLGYGRDELIGMNPDQFDAEKTQEFRDDFRARVDKGEIVTFETHHRRKDGSIFPVEVRIRPFKTGEQMRYISTARDISERERAEDELRLLNRELRAIGHCHQALLRANDELGLLDEICRIICEEAGYVVAWVGFAENDKEKTVIPIAWAGVEDGYVEDANISWSEDSPNGNGPTGKAIRSGEIVYTQDIATDPSLEPWRDRALERGFRASAVFPLKNGRGEVFGALTIYASESNAMTCAELRLLSELADDLAFGIHVIRVRAAGKKAEEGLQENKLELEKSNVQLRQLAARREETIEKEKTEIARNVHDELGQLLTALKMRLSMLDVEYGEGNKALKQDIEYVEDLSDKAMVAARDVISALRPPSLDMGLAVSLEWLAQQYTKNTGIDCSVKFGNCEDCRDEATKKSVCTTMYRIAQEGLTNIARYAQANQVDICMSDSDGVCQMTIRDNGIGFDPKLVKENSFGLIGIRERAEILGGTFAIDSEEGHGTEILVRIPQPAKSAESA